MRFFFLFAFCCLLVSLDEYITSYVLGYMYAVKICESSCRDSQVGREE